MRGGDDLFYAAALHTAEQSHTYEKKLGQEKVTLNNLIVVTKI